MNCVVESDLHRVVVGVTLVSLARFHDLIFIHIATPSCKSRIFKKNDSLD